MSSPLDALRLYREAKEKMLAELEQLRPTLQSEFDEASKRLRECDEAIAEIKGVPAQQPVTATTRAPEPEPAEVLDDADNDAPAVNPWTGMSERVSRRKDDS